MLAKVGEAKIELLRALSTLAVTEDVTPLSALHAKRLLENAETLAENEERSENDSNALSDQLKVARIQLRMAGLLGYGTRKSYQAMYDQINEIRTKTERGMGGKGLFDKVKQDCSALF